MKPSQQEKKAESDFVRHAGEKPTSIFGEYLYFLRTTGKWWLLPILIVILVFGAVLVVAGSPLAPFIYALF